MNEYSEVKLPWSIENSEGKCPKCQSGMILLRGKDDLFFGCSKYLTKGCKGTARPKKQDFLDLIDMQREYQIDEEAAESLSGSMYAYPDWDPDKEDIDSYLDANGLS
jgi:hypothetical protein